MKRYLVELAGTFALMLTIILASKGGTGVLAPAIVGLTLTLYIYLGATASGAHYNPAVTIAIWLRGKFEIRLIPGYFVSQIMGSVLAVLVSPMILEDLAPPITSGPIHFEFAAGMIAEVIGTLALIWVILVTGTSKRFEGNRFFGLAIGLTVMAGAYLFGSTTGASFNPAVSLGMCMSGMVSWNCMPTFLLAQFVAALIGAYAFRVIMQED